MKPSLNHYIIGVAVVWAIILCAAWFINNGVRFKTFAQVCGGFAIGMLAMYLAMHVYR